MPPPPPYSPFSHFTAKEKKSFVKMEEQKLESFYISLKALMKRAKNKKKSFYIKKDFMLQFFFFFFFFSVFELALVYE